MKKGRFFYVGCFFVMWLGLVLTFSGLVGLGSALGELKQMQECKK